MRLARGANALRGIEQLARHDRFDRNRDPLFARPRLSPLICADDCSLAHDGEDAIFRERLRPMAQPHRVQAFARLEGTALLDVRVEARVHDRDLQWLGYEAATRVRADGHGLRSESERTVFEVNEAEGRVVPPAAIVDIDVLKEGGTVWANFLKGAFIPEITRKSLEIARSHLIGRFKTVGKDMKKDGIAALGDPDKKSCVDLFKQLAAYGLFVVDCGELERWLSHLGVTGKAPDWLIAMFDKLGSDPDDAAYVRPSTGDVWEFMRGIAAWLRDPLRQGMAD